MSRRASAVTAPLGSSTHREGDSEGFAAGLGGGGAGLEAAIGVGVEGPHEAPETIDKQARTNAAWERTLRE
jgi:hypothetical protein